MVSKDILAAGVILVIACILLGCDRFLRYRTEGFTSPAEWYTGIMPGFCGVDLPSCPQGTRCINAYCQPDLQPVMPPTSGLPVKPEGYIRL
jgi:hypothetical protein